MIRHARSFSGLPLLLLPLLLALSLATAGCNQGNAQPTPRVTTVIGTSAPCAACDKKIAKVTEQNTFTYKGVQYVVCNKTCADEIRKLIDFHDE